MMTPEQKSRIEKYVADYKEAYPEADADSALKALTIEIERRDDAIYTLTLVTLKPGGGHSTRIWGYYWTWDAAEVDLLMNNTDLMEIIDGRPSFDFAVIERVGSGVLSYLLTKGFSEEDRERWYELLPGGRAKRIDKPERFRATIAWGIG